MNAAVTRAMKLTAPALFLAAALGACSVEEASRSSAKAHAAAPDPPPAGGAPVAAPPDAAPPATAPPDAAPLTTAQSITSSIAAAPPVAAPSATAPQAAAPTPAAPPAPARLATAPPATAQAVTSTPVASPPATAPPATAPPVVAPFALVPVPLPGPRHGHRVERIRGGLLSFGGFGDSSAEDREMRQTWWLGPGEPRWQRRADMGRARAFFASAVLGESVFAVGDGVERYDFAADRWVELVPPGRLPTSHFSAAAVGSTLYVLGGVAADGPESMLAVELTSGEVRSTPAPPGYARGDHFHVVAALAGRLHVIGGLDRESFRPRKEHWVLQDGSWRALPAPPDGVWAKFCAQVVLGDELFLFGDFGAWRFDARSGVWAPRASVPSMLVMPQTIAEGGSLWVMGGMPVEGPRKELLLRYDIGSDQWFDLTPSKGR